MLVDTWGQEGHGEGRTNLMEVRDMAAEYEGRGEAKRSGKVP